MEPIASFTIDHLKLLPGLYVSRKDKSGGVTVTTFDIRVTRPNFEPVMDMPAVHTIEHIGATFLRNSPEQESIVYFGPMGCRTGFYLLVFGDRAPGGLLPLVKAMFEFIIRFEGEIPGATAAACGNYLEQNLAMAKFYAQKYLAALERSGESVYSAPG